MSTISVPPALAMPGRLASKLEETQQLYIDGSYTVASNKKTFVVANPMTGERLYHCCAASKEDYLEAIETAHKAFKKWSALGPSARRSILLKAADIIETYLEDDAPEILSREVAATRSWTELNIKATAGILRESASLATHIKGDLVPADRPGTTIIVERIAVGVVFAVSPWNAPVNLTARAIATPLICGNAVVLKPSEYSPKSQHLVVRALIEAGLPRGVLNYLPTAPLMAADMAQLTIKHQFVRRINFTGSARIGRVIAGWAAEVLKQCLLELGGKAPLLVLDDANIEDAVEAAVFGAFSNSGQICMSTERIILSSAVAEKFKGALVKRVAAVKVGNHAEDPAVSVSALISPIACSRVVKLVDAAVKQGAKLLTGSCTPTGPNQSILTPMVLDHVKPTMPIFHEESFGPVLCITECSSDDEAVHLANHSEYTLCASVFTKDIMRGLDVARRVRGGSCHVNGPTVYIEPTLPNGGTGGSSGYGRFGGIAGVEEFTDKKIITLAKPGIECPF